MPRLSTWLLVGTGGFVGANARYLIARLLASQGSGAFPLATFIINVSGSFLLGLLGWWVQNRAASPTAEVALLALGVGFLGAYTTFSTFEYETHTLLVDGAWRIAALNVLGSVAAGLLAVRAGVVVARACFG